MGRTCDDGSLSDSLALLLLTPLAVRAQQPKMPLIGFLQPGTPEDAAQYVAIARSLDQGFKKAS